MDGNEHSRNHATRAEEHPHKRFVRSLAHLPSQKDPGHGHRYRRPDEVAGGHDEQAGNSLSTHAHRHRFWGQVEPGRGVEYHEQEGEYVDCEKNWISQPFLEIRIGRRPTPQRPDLQHGYEHEPGDENAAQFAKDESQIRPAVQPPVGGDSGSERPGRILCESSHLFLSPIVHDQPSPGYLSLLTRGWTSFRWPARRAPRPTRPCPVPQRGSCYFLPHGIRKDFIHSLVAVSLYC